MVSWPRFHRLAAVLLALAGPCVASPSASPWDPAPRPEAPAVAAPAATGAATAATSPEAPGARLGADGSVVVTRRLGGPAMWKVEEGNSQVFILGAATPLPHQLVWDTQRTELVLNGADALYLQPRPSFSPFALMKLALSKGPLQLAPGQTLQGVLPPAARARFLRVVGSMHARPQTYERWKPAVAGLFLIADWRKAMGLSEAKPGSTVQHLAEDAHVPVKTVGDFRLDPYVEIAAKLSAADNLACFDAALDDIEHERDRARPTAEAWARADLKAVGQDYRLSLLDGCLLRVAQVQSLVAKGTQAGVDAVQTALATPGRSLAVIDLNFLLRPGGVLDRLKASGATVTVPD